MSDHWDVIVIGAGIGGLTAAALLGEKGFRVLVLEKAEHIGGTAYIYQRNGYCFPMGPLGFSNPDLVKDILKEVGVREELALKRVHYGLRAFGQDTLLSLPFQKLATKLATLYPSEQEGIRKFFNDITVLSSPAGEPSLEFGTNVQHLLDISAADYLRDLVDDWRLRRILGSIGTREPYSGLPLLAAMWSLLCKKGIYYPRGGMRLLCELLAGRIDGLDDNARLKLGVEVVEIRVEDGRSRGVTLADGSVLETDAVISNADYKSTFLRLIPPTAVPDELIDDLSKAPQTMSNLQVSLGFNPKRVDLSAFAAASRLIYRRDETVKQHQNSGLDWKMSAVDPEALAGEELEIDLLSLDDPCLAPENKAVFVIRVAADYHHFTAFRPGWRKRAPGYGEYKERLAQALVSEASNLVPGLAEAIELTDVATPLTFEESGGRSDGAVAGWSWEYPLQHGLGVRELVLTPIAGLYMAGYQSFSTLALGGVPSAMRSGLLAAHYAIEKAGPVERMDIPGSQ